jgi:hypothetical protein
MDYKKYILNILLDKYEASVHFKEGRLSSRRIIMCFNDKDFPYYDIENYDSKSEIHYIIDLLENKGIVEVQWLKLQKNNIIEKIYLNTNYLNEAYIEAERKPKLEQLSELLDNVNNLRSEIRIDWICKFLDFVIEEIKIKKRQSKYIPRDRGQQELLFLTLKGIQSKGTEEILERVFSRRYLSNSKNFENEVKSRLITIIKDFLLKDDDWENKEDLKEATLQEIGIVKSSEELLFCGPISIKLGDSILDFKPFIHGSSMNTNMIKEFCVQTLNVNKVITIENKANYQIYIKRKPDRELVVYLGGFYSPIKKIFLEKIYQHSRINDCSIEFYHWGDIDYGGFKIFEKLQSQIIEGLRPLNMDIKTLNRYLEYSDSIDKDYKIMLSSLLENKKYIVFHELIHEMIRMGIKLEQEALLV